MAGAARKTDRHAGICDHGLRCCPHNVSGEITSGSGDTDVNDLPLALLLDSVTHNCPHCGTGYISSASGTVDCNGRGVAREGDDVTYPGGAGKITTGSGDVDIGG